MERRLAAILAGDVVGYSRLMAENEAETYGRLRGVFDEVVGPAVERHQGRIFKTTGDGFIAAFGSVNEALAAAVEIQDALAARPLKMRLGLNLGDVIEQEGDVYGDGVNVAARLEAMAEPGGICVSDAVVRSAKAGDVRFERIGRRRAKNLPDPVEVYVVRRTGDRRASALPAWRAAAIAAAAGALAIGFWGMNDERLAALTSRFLPSPQPAAVAAQTDSRPVVAVLPFDNLSGDTTQEYFADGLTEDIITDLAGNRDLMVIARNSTFAFKGRATDVRTIGAELGAGYVVEGSARRDGDQFRVVAQLIDASTGTHLWSRSYDRRLADVFAVQTELTAQIVASLVSYVRQSEAQAAVERPTENPGAYDLVLRARSRFQHAKDPGMLGEARALYARAVALDPNYAAARAYLGLTYISDSAARPTGQGAAADLERGIAEARAAIRLEPDLALGYQVLSYGLAAGGDYEASLKAGERAVELSPSDPDSLMALAKAQVRFGAYASAVANAERARRLHPMAPSYYPYVHGQALYAADREREAAEVLAECLLDAPRDPSCLKLRAASLVRLGRLDEARDAMAALLAAEPSFSLAGERAYRRFGNSPLMQRFLQDLAAAGAPEAVGRERLAEEEPA